MEKELKKVKKISKMEKKIKKQESKGRKHPVLSAIARTGAAGLSGLANAFLPGSGGIVHGLSKAILNGLGLAEQSGDKSSLIPAEFGGGGDIVAAADAPVQFGRMGGPATFSEVTHRGKNGDVIVHIKEPLSDVSTSSTLNTRATNQIVLTPVVSTLVASRQVSLDFEFWRPIAVRIHYTHWAATTTVARVAVSRSGDPNFNNGNCPTFIQQIEMQDSTVGSGYEDFFLDLDCSEQPYNWLQTAATAATASPDARLSQMGSLFWGVDLNNVTSTTIGTLFVEWILAFRSVKPPDVLIGLARTLRYDPLGDLTCAEKGAVFGAYMQWLALPVEKRGPCPFSGGYATPSEIIALCRKPVPLASPETAVAPSLPSSSVSSTERIIAQFSKL
jgi:hypothetical protein